MTYKYIAFLRKMFYPQCLVPVGFMNGSCMMNIRRIVWFRIEVKQNTIN